MQCKLHVCPRCSSALLARTEHSLLACGNAVGALSVTVLAGLSLLNIARPDLAATPESLVVGLLDSMLPRLLEGLLLELGPNLYGPNLY